MTVGHKCDAPISVIIVREDAENVRIPVVDDGVVYHEWKDGPLSYSRRAEVDFPLASGGEEWFEYIKAFTEEGGMQEAIVKMKSLDHQGNIVDDEKTLLRGYIGGTGSAGDNTGHITIFGPYKLLSQMSTDVNFKLSSVAEVMRYVATKLNEWQNIIAPVGYNASQEFTWTRNEPNREGDITSEVDLSDFGKRSEQFSSNRDTLADILKWAIETWPIEVFFETVPAAPDKNILTARGEAHQQHDATTEEDLSIIKNNATYEMQPFNTVVLKGEPHHDIQFYHTQFGTPFGEDTGYPEAAAWYPPLVARANGRIAQTIESSQNDADNVEQEARAALKKHLDEVSGGTITFSLSPEINTFDLIYAHPACADVLGLDLPKLNYEVQRVAHKVAPNNFENNIPSTEVSVSMAVDISDIKSSSTMVDIAPGEGLDNKPGEVPDWVPEWDIE